MTETETTPALSPLAARLVALIDADGRPALRIAGDAGLDARYLSDLRSGRRGGKMPAALLAALLRGLGVHPADAGAILYECHPADPAAGK